MGFYFYWLFYLIGVVSTSVFPSQLLNQSPNSDILKELKVFFDKHLTGVDDPAKIHYALIGLKSIGLYPKNPDALCKILQKKPNSKSEMFHRMCGSTLLGKTCQLELDEVFLNNTRMNVMHAEELFEDVLLRKCSSRPIDSIQILKRMDQLAVGDKNPINLALILQTAAQLHLAPKDAKRFVFAISVALQQADEVDGMLFYEKGLYTTAMVAIGIFDFIDKYGSTTDVSESQLTKLLKFVITRRYSSNLRAAAYLRKTIDLVKQNRIALPVFFEVVDAQGTVRLATGGELPKADPLLQVKLTTLSTHLLTSDSISVTAHGLRTVPDGSLVGLTERGLFVYDKVRSAFQLHLSPTSEQPELSRGYYWLELDVNWKANNETRILLGGTNVRLPLRIVTNASIVSSKMTIFDAAHERHVSDITLKPGSLYSAGTPVSLDVDHQVRLTVHLAEAVSSGAAAAAEHVPLTAQQVFVQLTHQTTRQAITFICNKALVTAGQSVVGNAQTYELLLDPKKSAVDFDNLPGVYKMEVIVGDSLLSRPLIWHMADLQLSFLGTFGEETQQRTLTAQDVSRRQLASAAASKVAKSLVGTGPGQMKPHIEHLFRPSEKRAPKLFARLFSVACAIPFLGMLAAWAVIGLNLGNFMFTISGMVFHAGLVAIFCLYYAYWCYLDMFTTLGYLALLGTPTFLAGNSLLRGQLVMRYSILKK